MHVVYLSVHVLLSILHLRSRSYVALLAHYSLLEIRRIPVHFSCLLIIYWWLFVLLRMQKLLLLTVYILQHISFGFTHSLALVLIHTIIIFAFQHLWWIICRSLIPMSDVFIIERSLFVLSRSLGRVWPILFATFRLYITFVLLICVYTSSLNVYERSWIENSSIILGKATLLLLWAHRMAHQTGIGCIHALFILLCILHSGLSACCIWIRRMMCVWLGWSWLTFWNLNRQWERI